MDQPISCQDIYYIYKHPLSILIHLKFQDKDGCSKNGSREFLTKTELSIGHYIEQPKFDSRGVVLMLKTFLSKIYSDEVVHTSMQFKQLFFWQPCKIGVCEEDANRLRSLSDCFMLGEEDLERLINDPTFVASNITTCFGRVTKLNLIFEVTNEVLHTISTFPHLRYLQLTLTAQANMLNFEEEIEIFSSLQHLSLSLSSPFHSLASCQFLSTLSKLKSFELSSYFPGC